MIGALTGIMSRISDDTALIDVNGVGYLVYCSEKTLSTLSLSLKKTVSLFIETIVREDMIRLYGFENEREQLWFLKLTSVQGIGPKGALAILSTLTIDALELAIASDDKAMIARAPGVGKRVAERIVTELRDKIIALPNTPNTASNAESEALSALLNLGFPRSDVFQVLQSLDKSLPLETLIKEALKRLNA